MGNDPVGRVDPTGEFLAAAVLALGGGGTVSGIVAGAGTALSALATAAAPYAVAAGGLLLMAADNGVGGGAANQHAAQGRALSNSIVKNDNTSESTSDAAEGRKRGPGNVANEEGVRVDIYSKDHAPPHAHVKSGNRDTRVGQNGKPLKGEGELTKKEGEVVKKHVKELRDRVRDMMQDHGANQR